MSVASTSGINNSNVCSSSEEMYINPQSDDLLGQCRKPEGLSLGCDTEFFEALNSLRADEVLQMLAENNSVFTSGTTSPSGTESLKSDRVSPRLNSSQENNCKNFAMDLFSRLQHVAEQQNMEISTSA